MNRRALMPIAIGVLSLFVSAATATGADLPSDPVAAAHSVLPLPLPQTASLLSAGAASAALTRQDRTLTATPIKHLVVVFGENRSFDHYFGTYPYVPNPPGEPQFRAVAGTTTPNGLTHALLTDNPNATNAANVALAAKSGVNPAGVFNPFRIDRAQANTADQNHAYTAEQLAYDGGKADAFPANTGSGSSGGASAFGTVGQVMGYFDGNTVTGLWNYAQHFAMSDNMYTDTYGPSTPGALEVVSGTTNGAKVVVGTASGSTIADGKGGFTQIGDTDPAGDVCSSKSATVQMTSKNIGDLLNEHDITWGGFMGGFDLTATNPNGTTGCSRSTYSGVLGASPNDYVQHHAWFQYYASTSNPAHTRPTSVAYVGYNDPLDRTATPVHHQYDVTDFKAAVGAGNFPSVSFIKAPAVGDAHPGNSDPLDEQQFVVNLVNFLEQQPDWNNTAVIVTYDDSDGWYDHRFATPTTSSHDATSKESAAASAANGSTLKSLTSTSVTGADQLDGAGVCTGTGAQPGVGVNGEAGVNGRCGPGTRIPLIVISPWAKVNYIGHTQITQASVVKFIEDNWLSGERIGQGSNDATTGSLDDLFDFTTSGGHNAVVYLDPATGTLERAPAAGSNAGTGFGDFGGTDSAG